MYETILSLYLVPPLYLFRRGVVNYRGKFRALNELPPRNRTNHFYGRGYLFLVERPPADAVRKGDVRVSGKVKMVRDRHFDRVELGVIPGPDHGRARVYFMGKGVQSFVPLERRAFDWVVA